MEPFDFFEALSLANCEEVERASGISFNPDDYEVDDDWNCATKPLWEEFCGHLNGACNNL